MGRMSLFVEALVVGPGRGGLGLRHVAFRRRRKFDGFQLQWSQTNFKLRWFGPPACRVSSTKVPRQRQVEATLGTPPTKGDMRWVGSFGSCLRGDMKVKKVGPFEAQRTNKTRPACAATNARYRRIPRSSRWRVRLRESARLASESLEICVNDARIF